MKADGFCKETQTAFEFQGCFWHGCKKCFNGDTINGKNQIDMATLQKRTIEKNEKIRAAGFELVKIYECELKDNHEFRVFMRNDWKRECVEPLNPRDTFFGGRSNITKLTYDFKEN